MMDPRGRGEEAFRQSLGDKGNEEGLEGKKKSPSWYSLCAAENLELLKGGKWKRKNFCFSGITRGIVLRKKKKKKGTRWLYNSSAVTERQKRKSSRGVSYSRHPG